MESMVAWGILDAAGALHFGGAMIAAKKETREASESSAKSLFSSSERATLGKTDRRKHSSATRRPGVCFGPRSNKARKLSPDLQDSGGGTRVTRRGGPSRATATARARARFQKGDDGTCARAVAARTSPPRVRRGGARARRRHWRCLLRRRAATGVTRFRKRARSRSRDAVPSKHAVRVDTNVTNEALALPEPRVPPWTAPSRRRARRVHEPASRLAAGRGC